MMWKTEEPPQCYWDQAPDVWTRLLQQRGWLDDWGWLQIPTWLTKPRHNVSGRELQMEPDAHPWDPNSGTYSPISRLAEHVVVWHPDDWFLVQGHKTRSARDMRDHLSRYKRRCFSKPWEADASWYQPCRARQDDTTVPADALCVVQPFHPGVLNILFPYAPTLAKQRELKELQQKPPSHGRYESMVRRPDEAPPLKSPRAGGKFG